MAKLLRKAADRLDDRKHTEKLDLWKRRLSVSQSARAAESGLMNEREALYGGTRKIDGGGNAPVKPASSVRNIVAEIIEAQVDSNIPQPKVTARHAGDEGLAKLVEDLLRNELDRMPFETLNDEQERTCPIQGGSLFLCEWDNRRGTHTSVGELAVSLLHPKQVIPQAGVNRLADMDYLMIQTARTREAVKRQYRRDVSGEGEENPDARCAAEADTAEDLVTVNTAYYRNGKGGIGQFVWVGDIVLSDLEDYQARRLNRCKKCGEPGDGERCWYCGSRSFEETAETFETLTEDVQTANGVIPMYEADEFGMPEPVRLPLYRPGVFPVALRRNVSIFGKLLGDSDVDKIRDQQNLIKKLETKVEEKLLKGGSYAVLPKGVAVRRDDGELKVLEVDNVQQKAMIDVITMQADTNADRAVIEENYQSARNIIGVTDSFQGRRDPTATSGKAKEFAAAQSAGRLESKRVMKNAAYAELFELMFKFILAYADEPRPVTSRNRNGEVEYKQFNRYDFLKRDAAGEWYWNDEFLFSTDTSAPLANNREAMWQETRMNLQQGTFGDPADLRTLIRFWTKMELLHYPGASDTKADLEEELQNQMAARAAPMMGGVENGIMPALQGGNAAGTGQPGQPGPAVPQPAVP